MSILTAYRRGVHFEKRVQEALEEMGWVVFRSAGSRSLADLVALRSGEVLLIQCKSNGAISPRERGLLGLLGHELGVATVLAYRKGNDLCWKLIDKDGALEEEARYLPPWKGRRS